MNLFIFVYNVSDRSTFVKICEQYEHIKSMTKAGNLNCLLIGMHFSPKNKIVNFFDHFFIYLYFLKEISYEEANKFAEKMNFLGFLVTNKKNSAVNKNVNS